VIEGLWRTARARMPRGVLSVRMRILLREAGRCPEGGTDNEL
jgi:hypothetical protein